MQTGMAARQTLRMKAKRDLEQHMKQHMKQHGCFHCRKKGNLQFSHLLRAKKDGDPRKMVCYVVKASRRAKVTALRKEMKKCGILCRRCHDAYDAHQRWGHPKVAWATEGLGKIYAKQGNLAEALDHYAKAAKLWHSLQSKGVRRTVAVLLPQFIV